MIPLEPPFRIATAADAPHLADLVNFAGEGLPEFFWTELAAQGQDPWEIGRARQAEKAAEGQIVVADFGQGAVASLTGYAIGPEPTPVGPDFPALMRPLQELENLVPDSWYVNVLATYPEHRGKGLGAALLGIAERIAVQDGKAWMSVIVADNNQAARRLYERVGYRMVASRACHRGGWKTETDNWVLLTKTLGL